ncbi:DNA polymerase II [Neptunomonas qingdaonensis]|uniref:DNA polymerase n=1 Tax=Neptunomonas qingdaonensis TaxID=1045558 RepID=A0A1I2NR11_9GAMM|nr:DNA polymerase II [Neptunomonas qingdaonensis]SFG06272.1 DNA polymerase-2 [Neptunomonas qingdaonensis]
MTQIRGFVLTRHQQDQPDGIELRYWIKNQQDISLVSVTGQESVFFVHDAQLDCTRDRLKGLTGWRLEKVQLRDLEQQGVHALYCRSLKLQRDVIALLSAAAIPMMEEDIRPVDRFLMERFIFGGVEVTQSALSDGVVRSRFAPCEFPVTLKILSVDIETTMQADRIHSIGLYGADIALVLMRGEGVDSETLRFYPDERTLLQAFVRQVCRYDPDIFIGWNVVGFDFRVLAERADKLKVPLRLGRDDQSLRVVQSELGKWYVRLEGRLVIDGIDTLKGATFHFESYSLEYVSQSLFKRGKLIHQANDRGAEIQRLYREDKPALARYNLEDCKLVQDIFDETRLMEYLIERTRLTGLSLDKVGGSAAAFDFQYLPRLHRSGYVAPEFASGDRGIGAPGGYVMDSQPGLYQHVLVLDFKSLYPSIIRTFKIDPAGLAEGLKAAAREEDLIPGFSGAIFSKSKAILPTIIEELWVARDQAKRNSNKPLSQAIKIIMNAFYGVLGSNVCRFFDPRLAGSITLRGHQILQQTRDEIERTFGYRVIYGDTDSVFVLLGDECSDADLQGKALADYLNSWWSAQVEERFNTENYLELEYETHYSRFLMPRMRHSEKGSKKRYAGLQQRPDKEAKLVFKGLENVRSDWTPLARNIQQQLYEAVFRDQPYHDFLKQLVADLRQGKLDDQLVYRRRLRQPLADYLRMKPPHVQAAIKAEKFWQQQQLQSPYQPGQHVSYIMTVNGPEPIEQVRSPIDYEHYVEKQLEPVIDSILCFKEESLQSLIATQRDLFS